MSKGFNIIERFSEDIDLAINHSFFGIEKTSKNQREKLRKINFMIPDQERDAWMQDYADMQRFFIYGKSLDFDSLIKRIEELQRQIKETQKM